MSATFALETEWTGMVAGVGASAGGVPALRSFFKALPEQCNLAFVVILHSQPDRPSQLSRVLRACTQLQVCEIEDGDRPTPNHVHVARSDHSVALVHGRFRTQPRAPLTNGPGIQTIDGFLESLASDIGKRAIAIVLSGMGSDGSAGAMRLKQHGGTVFVQDPDTAEHGDMPLATIGTGAVDRILPVEHLAQEVIACGSRDYRAPAPSDHLVQATDALELIFSLVRDRTGFDLSGYKITPLVWRITRQLQVRRLHDLAEYAALLQREPDEIDCLVRNIPIHVTQFFRDPLAWEELKSQVVDRLIDDPNRADPIRVWSAACASGEEAYSIAMLLSEGASEAQSPVNFRVFATDAAPQIVAQASRGVFPERAMQELTAERQARFFRPGGGAQQVCKALREKLVFAPQHLIADPPFRDLDLVICRNLFIYLDTQATRRVIALLHSALRIGGYLFLGASESLPADYSGFEAVSLRFRIFRKVGPIARHISRFPTRVTSLRDTRDWSEELRVSHEELDASREELQAVNEELRAVNDQLSLGNEELNAVNAKLRRKIEELQLQSSVLSSGGIMTLFLDEELRVCLFTPAMSALFPLMPGDIGRPISDLSPNFRDPDFIRDVLDVMRTGIASEKEIRSSEGVWYTLRIFPFRGGSDLRKGVAITFANITERVSAERALRENEHRFRGFVMATADIVYRMNPDWSEMWQLRGAGRIPDLPEPSASWLDVYIHPDDRKSVVAAAQLAVEEKRIFDAKYRVRRIDDSFVLTHSQAVPILDERGNIIEWLGTVNDVVAADDLGALK